MHPRCEMTFRRLKDGRRVVTPYDRCPKVSPAAIILAATVMFWLSAMSLGFHFYLAFELTEANCGEIPSARSAFRITTMSMAS